MTPAPIQKRPSASTPKIRSASGFVWCELEARDLENESGASVPGFVAICGRCGHETESYGTTERSVLRCLALLREECPRDERNLYGNITERPEPRPPGSFARRVRQGLDRIFGECPPC